MKKWYSVLQLIHFPDSIMYMRIFHTTAPGIPTIKIGDIKNASSHEKTSDRQRILFYLFLKTVTGHGKKMGSFYDIHAIEFFL